MWLSIKVEFFAGRTRLAVFYTAAALRIAEKSSRRLQWL